MKKIKILASLCGVALLFACKKNEHSTSFTGEPKIFFAPNLSSDSLLHSFANYPAVPEKQLLLPLQIMGKLEDRDRTVQVEIDPSGTTAAAGEYELGQHIVIPAGSTKGNLPLKIKVSPRLETGKVQLTLRLKPSADFGVEPEKSGKNNELVKFRVIWTNILAKPTDWPTTLWGGYSKVKHRLVIDLTGQSQFSGTQWTSSGMAYSIMGVCNEWLLAYNNSHPGAPYLDENGKEVRFCPTCN